MPTIKITDQNAIQNYDFQFRIGDRVKSRIGSHDEGVIVDGKCEISGIGGGSYQVTYQVKRDDGMFFDARQQDLEQAGATDS
jgi:hypothetical protein